ncbi:helix-turn-helix domain-containing protein [Aureivirga marina]|uniref:helix-turn-helix domain-containing protein n=1 Tax=Aureivirga marina TaxID=1182451 RepID=UPI0018CA6708|nr:AraC family transcriptional regulator [Aureivirga marina]
MKNIQKQKVEGFNSSKIIISDFQSYSNTIKNSPLSIKMVFSGKEKYFLENKPFYVTDNRYLIVNETQDFDLSIDEKNTRTKGVCIYPPADLVQEVYTHFSTSTCDDFLEKPYEKRKSNFSPLILKSKETKTGKLIQKNYHHFIEESNDFDYLDFYIELAQCMNLDQMNFEKVMKKLSATKKETKEELFRRLFLVRDFIHDAKNEKICIDELTKVACLSKYHLIRNFKELFHKSPYQYLLSLKLEKAKDLLQKGYSYQEISNLVGFSDVKNLRKSLRKTI